MRWSRSWVRTRASPSGPCSVSSAGCSSAARWCCSAAPTPPVTRPADLRVRSSRLARVGPAAVDLPSGRAGGHRRGPVPDGQGCRLSTPRTTAAQDAVTARTPRPATARPGGSDRRGPRRQRPRGRASTTGARTCHRRDRLAAWWHRTDVRWYLLAVALTAAAMTWMMRLWRADLRRPVPYDSATRSASRPLRDHPGNRLVRVPTQARRAVRAALPRLPVLRRPAHGHGQVRGPFTRDWMVAFNSYYLLTFVLWPRSPRSGSSGIAACDPAMERGAGGAVRDRPVPLPAQRDAPVPVRVLPGAGWPGGRALGGAGRDRCGVAGPVRSIRCSAVAHRPRARPRSWCCAWSSTRASTTRCSSGCCWSPPACWPSPDPGQAPLRWRR